MPKPIAWRVHWDALDNEPAGYLDFYQRGRARGFAMLRKAEGFTVSIEALTH